MPTNHNHDHCPACCSLWDTCGWATPFVVLIVAFLLLGGLKGSGHTAHMRGACVRWALAALQRHTLRSKFDNFFANTLPSQSGCVHHEW